MRELAKHLKFIKYIIPFILVGIALRNVNMRELWQVITNANPVVWFCSFMMTIITLVFGTFRWRLFLGVFKQGISAWSLFILNIISVFYNTFVPGNFAGDIVKGVRVKSDTNTFSSAFASVFMDRLFGLLGLVLLAAISMVFSFGTLLQIHFAWYGIAALCLFLSVFVIFSKPVLSQFKLLEPLLGTYYKKINNFIMAIQLYWGRKDVLFYGFSLTLAAHMAMILGVFLISRSLGGDVSFRYFMLFIPVIHLISYLPISVGGLGVREAGYVLLFSRVGLSDEQALSMSLLFFLNLVLLALLGGVVSLIPSRILQRHQSNVAVSPKLSTDTDPLESVKQG